MACRINPRALSRALDAQSINPDELAELTGINSSTVYNWLSGKHNYSFPSKVQLVADTLGVPFTSLIADAKKISKPRGRHATPKACKVSPEDVMRDMSLIAYVLQRADLDVTKLIVEESNTHLTIRVEKR